MPDFFHEAALTGVVCGVDEVGAGPIAGPVFAGAAILDRARLPADLRVTLDDSKRLSAGRRVALLARLREEERTGIVRLGIGSASVAEIDSLNILRATHLAMSRAVAALGIPVEHALVDGNKPPPLPARVHCIIGGDGKSLSIAAASILAKVTRDQLMLELAAAHPGYGWERNMGYPTEEHRAALLRLGPTAHHRRSFAGVVHSSSG